MPRPLIGAPATVEECTELAEWARSLPASRPAPATTETLRKHLGFMAATLPTKRVDDETGKDRLAVYVSLLRDLSEPALTHMSREACRRLDWFPTPKQCLEIAAEWRAPVSERDATLRLCHDTAEALFAAWLAGIGRGEISEAPDRWLRIAVERGLIRRTGAGEFVIRSAAAGDVAPPPPPPPAKPLPTIDDYIAHGLTGDEARDAVEQQARAA